MMVEVLHRPGIARLLTSVSSSRHVAFFTPGQGNKSMRMAMDMIIRLMDLARHPEASRNNAHSCRHFSYWLYLPIIM